MSTRLSWHGSSPAPEGEALEVSRVHTFLIADIRGYSTYTSRHGDASAAALSAQFHEIAEGVIAQHGGRVLGARGDEVVAVFTSVRQALTAGVELQRELAGREDPISAGVGIDAGEAIPVGSDFRGSALNLAARLCSIALPSQVLVSDAVRHLAGSMATIHVEDQGLAPLKGFADPVRVLEIREAGSAAHSVKPADGTPVRVPEGGYLGARPDTHMVAREPELAQIRSLLDEAGDHRGCLLLISGEPGVGKTRLSQAATMDAAEREFVIATGRCYATQQAVPYFPFREALAVALRNGPGSIRASATRHWPYLARLLPDAGFPTVPPASTSFEEQQRIHSSVAGLLTEIAEAVPIAIFFDDLQWADASSIDLLLHVARQGRAHSIFLLATFRDTDIDSNHPLKRAIVDLTREHVVERIQLMPLTVSETAVLIERTLGAAPSPDLVRVVFERTDGNPLFAEELVRELQAAGHVEERHGELQLSTWSRLRVPETVRMVIGQRLARLSPSTQDLLAQISVLGQVFTFSEAEMLTARSEDDLDESLEEATAAGLVKFLHDDRYTFNHALTQQALYAELSPRRCRRLHLQAADLLERQGEQGPSRSAEIAWHFSEAGDSRAYGYAVKAGDQAMAVFALPDAKVHYDLALEVARKGSDRRRQAVILEKLGALHTAMIDYPNALVALDESALIYAELDDQPAQARVEAQIGRVHNAAGSGAEGIGRLREVMPRLQGAGAIGRASMHSSLARMLLHLDHLGLNTDLQGYLHAITESLAALSYLGAPAAQSDDGFEPELRPAAWDPEGPEPGIRADALINICCAQALSGRWVAAEQAVVRVIGLAAGCSDYFSECRGNQHLAGIRMAQGRFYEASSSWTRALEIAQLMDNQRQIANALVGVACMDWLMGIPSTRSEEGLRIMRRLGGFWTPVLGFAGLALWPDGEVFEAPPPSLVTCFELGQPAQLSGLRSQVVGLRKELASGASARLLNMIREIKTCVQLEAEQAWTLDVLEAEALIAQDQCGSASVLCTDGLERAASQQLGLRIWEWNRVRSQLLEATGQVDKAHLLRSELEATAARMPYPHGREMVRRESLGADPEKKC